MNARASVLSAFALAVLAGRVVDLTTGQGLPHVVVSSGRARTTTDARGRYELRSVPVGRATVTVRSNDVPPQTFAIVVRSARTAADIRACSTTLDYSCARTPNAGGAPAPG